MNHLNSLTLLSTFVLSMPRPELLFLSAALQCLVHEQFPTPIDSRRFGPCKFSSAVPSHVHAKGIGYTAYESRGTEKAAKRFWGPTQHLTVIIQSHPKPKGLPN